jgi:hypothetical protein
MRKIIVFMGMILFFGVSFCLAQEEIAITTYYPSPYGVYNQLVTQTFGVGDNDGSGALDSSDVPDPSTNPGNVWIAGNVGIGTGSSTPGYRLEVITNASNSYVANFFNDGNNQNRYGLRVQAGADNGMGSTYYLNCYDGDGTNVGYIVNIAGNFQIVDPSDIRTKTNIVDTIIDGLRIINGLHVVDFNRIQDPDGPKLTGFIAQEVQEVYPQMVTTGPDGMLGVSRGSLIPVLVKAVQEQQTQIESLRRIIEDLKAQIKNGNDST